MDNVRQIVDSVERARTAVLDRVAQMTERQATFKPAESHWSIVEVVEHLYFAEMSGLTKIWLAARNYRDGERWSAARPNAGRTVEQIVEATWQPKEFAPAIATPHIGGPLACWRSAYRSLTSVLQELSAELEGLPLEDVVFPHFLSGPMDARQRLDFLRFHMERHIGQIDAIQRRESFPA